MGLRIAVDASRNRSGGAKVHLTGIISAMANSREGIDEVHVWSYASLLDALPDYPWLVKHHPPALKKNMLAQLWWQYRYFSGEVKKAGCDILLSTSAGTVCVHHPSVVMSRDMLSYERKEIARYGFGKEWLRLFVLRFVQSRSLKKADGCIFLTQYAADVIQTWTGVLPHYRVVHHGVSDAFRITRKAEQVNTVHKALQCLYISNVARYKHQWKVVEAFSQLHAKGLDVQITFAGGGAGPGQQKYEAAVARFDAAGQFTKQISKLSHEMIPPLLAEADIFIFASSCENMPNTLVEAMAAGLPIACSRLGPMPEILKDGGVYFDPEDAVSIAAAVEELVVDPQKRTALAIRAKQISNEYSWSRCAAETLAYLKEVHQQYTTTPQ